MHNKLHKSIAIELLSHLYRGLPTSIIGVSVNAILLAIVMWTDIDTMVLSFWISAVLIIGVYRYGSYLRFKRAGIPADSPDNLWLYNFVVPCLMHSLLWGFAGWYFFRADVLQHLIILSFLLAGLVAGAIVLLSAHKQLAVAYIAIILLPLSVRFFLEAQTVYVFMGAMVLLFLFVNINGIRQIYNKLYENIRLKLKAQENEKIRERNEAFLNNTGKITRIGGWDFDLAGSRFRWTQQVYDILDVPKDTVPTYETILGCLSRRNRIYYAQSLVV